MKARPALLGLLVAGLAACSAEPAATGGPRDAGEAADAAVDACALLTDAEVEPVVGAFEKRPQGLWCTWENTDDHHSVTVRVGASNTAPGDALPADSPYGPTEPGPDGTRFASGTVVEFAVDGRACDIQVVTGVGDGVDSDRRTAAGFAALVRERLG